MCIHKTDIRSMSREDWLRERRKGIGGSDAGALLGLSNFQSPYGLWAEKTEQAIPEDISDKEAVRLGNDLEQYCADRWTEATGKKARRCNFILRNDRYPFAHANPDRLVVGESAGLECKTTSSWEIHKMVAAGEIPPIWLCQCYHYLMVTGYERWYLAVLCFGKGFYHFTVERDDAEINALAGAESDFWDKVTNRIAPPVDGSEATSYALQTIFSDGAAGTKADLTAVGFNIESYNALSAKIRELELMRSEHENAIKEFMGSAESGVYRNVSISWKNSSRKTFDKAAWERDHGTISENYYKQSNARTFRVTIKKE